MYPSLDFDQDVRPPARWPADEGSGPRAARAGPGFAAPDWLASVLDEIDYGVLLLDADATLHFANSHALAACAADGPLEIGSGRILPRRAAEREAFLGALRAAGAGRRSMLQLRRPVPGEVLTLAVVPLERAATTPQARPVLVMSGRRQTCEGLNLQFFARAHGLTGAETAVLAALCRGLRPAAIARASGTTLATVRTHVGNVRRKTDSASIGEVVRRVTLLPPMVGALREGRPPREGGTG